MAAIDSNNKAEQLTRLGFNLCRAAVPEIATMLTPFMSLFVVRNKSNKTERDATLTGDKYTAFRKDLYDYFHDSIGPDTLKIIMAHLGVPKGSMASKSAWSTWGKSWLTSFTLGQPDSG